MLLRRGYKLLNIVISICLIGFIFVIMKGPSPESIMRESPSFPSVPDVHTQVMKEIEAELVNETIPDYEADQDISLWHFQTTGANFTISGQDIVTSVNFLNENFEILNLARFGPVEGVKFVIVIQVHNRSNYLGYLIESLRSAKGIQDALLVFSHDINVAVINDMIRNITFARVSVHFLLLTFLFIHSFLCKRCIMVLHSS
ncbi:unnamed protein product [Cylicostephanus goldi]|uniref:Hexosyltransferase n=1 Tax=Cylicostephanus goldi TaxID=71465 RepID=A0A3P6RIK3_CYLGO|nr:unnamed protein product [Cylicostephanus goldi]